MRYLFLLFLAGIAFADTGTIFFDETGITGVKCTTPQATCPPAPAVVCPTAEPTATCPPIPTPTPTTTPAPSPGNLHAAIHPQLAKTSRATCDTCHAAGKSIVKSDRTICAQYDFSPAGRTFIDPQTGLTAKDPVSGTEIVSGGHTAVLLKGETITCSTCHYPHGGPLGSGVKASNITTACLDCHVKVGSTSLKPGIKN